MILTQVIGPVDDVEKEEVAREENTGDDINLFGAELEGANGCMASTWEFRLPMPTLAME